MGAVTGWLALTVQDRPEPAVIVVPGTMPHFGVHVGHEITCPMAIVPVTDPDVTVSAVPTDDMDVGCETVCDALIVYRPTPPVVSPVCSGVS